MKKLCILLFLLPLHVQAQSETPAPKKKTSLVRPEAAPPENLQLPARTEPLEQAYLYSRATGTLGERRVDIGDRVKTGDILATIDAPEIVQEVAKGRAAVAQARARSELARLALARAKTMTKTQVIAAEALDQREADAKTSDADVQAAVAELGRLEEMQKFLTIRAPFDGIVAGRRLDRGDLVQGDQSQADKWMFYLVRLDELRVIVNAPPSAGLRLQPGQEATVQFSEMPGQKFSAQVARSGRVIDPASGTMRVELSLPNPDYVLPSGLTGVAAISVPAGATFFRVPTNAIVVRDGKNHVAKVEEGKINFSLVTTGRNFGDRIEILSGVTAQDSLLQSPNALLKQGDKLPGT